MIAPRQTLPDGLVHTVRKQDWQIISEHRISYSRLHADARRTAGDYQILDCQSLERCVEVGLVEAAEARLIKNDVTCLRPQLRNDVGIPRISDQHATFASVRRLNFLTDAQF